MRHPTFGKQFRDRTVEELVKHEHGLSTRDDPSRRGCGCATALVAMAVVLVVSVSGCSVLSPDPSPTADRATGRVELTDEAVAMTLDEAWWAEPGPSYEGLVPPPTHEVVLQLFYELGDGYCDLWIDRETDLLSGSLSAYAEQLIRDYEGDGDGDVSRGTVEPVSLPAGPAMRVRIEYRAVNPLTAHRVPARTRWRRLSACVHGLRPA